MNSPSIKIRRYQNGNCRQWLEVQEDTLLLGHVIPKGFKCDGASVPRYFWWIASPFGIAMYAAIIHDYQLSTFSAQVDAKYRKQVDKEFYNNLRETGMVSWRAWLLYRAVRLWSKIYTRLRYFKKYKDVLERNPK